MLPRPLRLTSATDHRAVVRRGRRAGAGALTVHVLPGQDGPTRVGLVVGKGVGNAVARHRVSRQLRHLLADRLSGLPGSSLVVVRAGASASGADLAADLDAALARVATSSRTRPQRSAPPRPRVPRSEPVGS